MPVTQLRSGQAEKGRRGGGRQRRSPAVTQSGSVVTGMLSRTVFIVLVSFSFALFH